MALSVKQLTDKKVRLSTQLETLSADTEAKIEKLNEAHELKVSATRAGIIPRSEKLAEDIAEVETLLQNEVATLQAQIEAIRGISETVVSPVTQAPEDIDVSEDLV